MASGGKYQLDETTKAWFSIGVPADRRLDVASVRTRLGLLVPQVPLH